MVGDLIDFLYDASSESKARDFIGRLFTKAGTCILQRAWQARKEYHDKPDIFVDFSSMVVTQDLGIIFTGDASFLQVNLGVRLVP